MDKAWGADDIYLGIMAELGGEAAIVEYGEEDLMTPQRSGTCAFMSLQALFYHVNVDKKISQKVRFQLLSAGIDKYVKWNEDRLSTSLQAQNIFSKTLEEYSRITVDMHEGKVISDGELVKAHNRIREFRKMLEGAKQAFLNEVEDSVGKINLNIRAVDWGRIIPIPQGSIIDPDKPVSSKMPAPLSGVHSIFLLTQGCTLFTLGYWPTPPSGGIFLSERM